MMLGGRWGKPDRRGLGAGSRQFIHMSFIINVPEQAALSLDHTLCVMDETVQNPRDTL